MKLKPIIALTALGLAAGTAMAAADEMSSKSSQGNVTLEERVAHLENHIRDNQGTFRTTEPRDNWFERIQWGGELTIPAVTSSRDSLYTDTRQSDVFVSDMQLHVRADISEMVEAQVNLAYKGSGQLADVHLITPHVRNGNIHLDQAFVNIKKDGFPVYAQFGVRYLANGDQVDLVGDELTQRLDTQFTMVHSTALNLGVDHVFNDQIGMNAFLTAFKGQSQGGSTKLNNWLVGASLDYDFGNSAPLGLQVGLNYLRDSQQTVIQKNGRQTTAGTDVAPKEDVRPMWTGFVNLVGDTQVSGHDVSYLVGGSYSKVSKEYTKDNAGTALTNNRKPSVWTLMAQAKVTSMEYAPSLAISYGSSKDAEYYGQSQQANNQYQPISDSRWIATLGVDLMENTMVMVQYVKDKDYGTSQNGTGKTRNAWKAGLNVKF